MSAGYWCCWRKGNR